MPLVPQSTHCALQAQHTPSIATVEAYPELKTVTMIIGGDEYRLARADWYVSRWNNIFSLLKGR